jgi:hypothetical protein
MAEQPVERCFIMLCTDKTERECLGRRLFGDRKGRLDYLKEIRAGDTGFLLNLSRNELIGVFKAQSEAQLDIQEEAWGGQFGAQVRVEASGPLRRVREAALVLASAGVTLVDIPSGKLVPMLPVQNRDVAKKLLVCLEKRPLG